MIVSGARHLHIDDRGRLGGALGRTIELRNQLQRLDVGLRRRFEPDGLPDARGRRVEDSAGLEGLLAVRLQRRLRWVFRADDDLVLSTPSFSALVISNVNGS